MLRLTTQRRIIRLTRAWICPRHFEQAFAKSLIVERLAQDHLDKSSLILLFKKRAHAIKFGYLSTAPVVSLDCARFENPCQSDCHTVFAEVSFFGKRTIARLAEVSPEFDAIILCSLDCRCYCPFKFHEAAHALLVEVRLATLKRTLPG
jgi:hypothetical protein